MWTLTPKIILTDPRLNPFVEPSTIYTPAAVGDVNGDGSPDIIVVAQNTSTYQYSFSVLFGDGSGGFTSGPSYALPNLQMVALADLSGNGKPDLVVLGYTGIAVYPNTGSGGFLAPSTVSLPGNLTNLAVGDVNGDGHQDVVISTDHGPVILEGNGSGGFGAPIALGGSGTYYSNPISLADMNGDGKLDIVVADQSTIKVYLNNGHGGFSAPSTYNYTLPGGEFLNYLAVADVTGDGRPDIVALTSPSGIFGANSATVLVIPNNGSGGLGAATSYHVNDFYDLGGSQSLNVADVNHDGRPDIIVGSNVAQVGDARGNESGVPGGAILLNQGNGNFGAPIYETDVVPVTTADVNADGHLDLVGFGGGSLGGGGNGGGGVAIDYGGGAGAHIRGPRGGHAILQGTLGSDVIAARGRDNKIFGGGGNDTIDGGAGGATIFVGGGSDLVTLHGKDNTVAGYAASDPDSVFGANGNTTVRGGWGHSAITLGNGNDKVELHGKDNLITLGTGNDTVDAGCGHSTVTIGNGTADTIVARGEHNAIHARDLTQDANAPPTNYTIYAGDGQDTVSVDLGLVGLHLGGGGDQVTLGTPSGGEFGLSDEATIYGGSDSQISVFDGGFFGNIAGAAVTVSGGADQTITLEPGQALGQGTATIDDLAKNLTLVAGSQNILTLRDVSKDTGFVLDLVGGAGGFKTVKDVLAGLSSDGKGGTLLTGGSFLGGNGLSADFVDTAQSVLTASHFKIG